MSQRLACCILVLVLAACSEDQVTGPNPLDPGKPAFSALVSNATPLNTSLLPAWAGSAAVQVAWVSMAPGTVEGATGATVRNRHSGARINTDMVDGGFDPVAIVAQTGDTLDITATASGATVSAAAFVVPPRRRILLVRTDPPPGKRDVPLNYRMAVVLSEPIEPVSLSENPLVLLQGTTPVPGTSRINPERPTEVTFEPAEFLNAGTDYVLVVPSGLRDQDGDGLESDVRIPFTTETPPATRLAFVGQPGGGIAGLYLPTVAQVEALDQYGNRVTAATGIVSLALGSNPGGATLIGAPVASLQSGVASFLALGVTQPGSGYTLVASRTDLESAVSAPFTVQPLVGRVAFTVVSNGGFTSEIFTMSPIGTDIVQLTHNTLDSDPRWSPDGRLMVFSRCCNPDSAGIYIMQADGTNLTRVRPDGTTPNWSPDGTRLVFACGSALCVMSVDGSGLSRISDPGLDGADLYPAWSPDGREIAFIRLVSYDTPWQIWLMSTDGSNLRRLTDPNASLQSAEQWPSWSPDGSRIAFWSAWSGILVSNRDGTGQHSLAPGVGGQGTLGNGGPDWSPDGSKILFGGDAHQYQIVNSDGTGLAQGITTPLPGTLYQVKFAWSRE